MTFLRRKYILYKMSGHEEKKARDKTVNEKVQESARCPRGMWATAWTRHEREKERERASWYGYGGVREYTLYTFQSPSVIRDGRRGIRKVYLAVHHDDRLLTSRPLSLSFSLTYTRFADTALRSVFCPNDAFSLSPPRVRLYPSPSVSAQLPMSHSYCLSFAPTYFCLKTQSPTFAARLFNYLNALKSDRDREEEIFAKWHNIYDSMFYLVLQIISIVFPWQQCRVG